jgi:hypothetical protein
VRLLTIPSVLLLSIRSQTPRPLVRALAIGVSHARHGDQAVASAGGGTISAETNALESAGIHGAGRDGHLLRVSSISTRALHDGSSPIWQAFSRKVAAVAMSFACLLPGF